MERLLTNREIKNPEKIKVPKKENNLQHKSWFKTSEENQNCLLAQLQCKSAMSSEKFGCALLMKCIKHKPNLNIEAQLLAKPF